MNKKDIKIIEEAYKQINEEPEPPRTIPGAIAAAGQGSVTPEHTPEEREEFIKKALERRNPKNSFKVVGEVKLRFVNPDGKVEDGFDEVIDMTGTSSWDIYHKIKELLKIED